MSLLLVVCAQVCGYYTAPKPYREEKRNLEPMSRRLLMHASPPSAAPRPLLARFHGREDSAAQLQVGATHSNRHCRPWVLLRFPQDLHCTTTMGCSQSRFHWGATRALRTNRRSRGSGTALRGLGPVWPARPRGWAPCASLGLGALATPGFAQLLLPKCSPRSISSFWLTFPLSMTHFVELTGFVAARVLRHNTERFPMEAFTSLLPTEWKCQWSAPPALQPR